MPPEDRDKLHCVSPYAEGIARQSDNPPPPPPPLPERRLRKWRVQLLREYRDQV
jgi:hypothetical protein